jgi:hypothetical protein
VTAVGRIRLVLGLVGFVAALVSSATADTLTARKWQQSLMYNGVPAPLIDTPGYTASKCLLPYPICKVMWAGISLVAAGEQLVTGGDVEGAGSAVRRGFGGDWIVRPRHVSGDWLWSTPLPPVTFAAAIATGRGNLGDVPLDPYPPAVKPVEPGAEETGDVLPP